MTNQNTKRRAGDSCAFSASCASFYSQPLKEGFLNNSEEKTNTTVEGYKAFKKDLTCNGFQFKEGKVFEEKEAILCRSGFHFCTNPFDVLNYYNLCDSEFCKVKALAESHTKKNGDSKHVTTKIEIGVKLGLNGFVKSMVDYLIDFCRTKNKTVNNADSSLAASGDHSSLAASGYHSSLAASGYHSRLAASGGDSRLAASGDYSRLVLNGVDSVAAAVGVKSKIKAKTGNWITLAEWKYDETRKRYTPTCVKSALVDGSILKEDVFYVLKNGEFVEVAE